VVWGSTYLAIRVMVETVPPLLGAGARFLLAGAGLWAILRIRRGDGAVRATRRELVACAIVGILLCFGGNGLVTVAEQEVPSSLAALLIASVPLWVVVLRAVSGERVPRRTALGVGLGFTGVAILLLPGGDGGSAGLGWLLLVVLAAALWATGSVSARSLPLPRDPLVSTTLQMTFGGLFMLVLAVPFGELGKVHPSEFSADSAWAFAYLVLIGSIVAYTAYAWLLQNVPISKVATYAYVNPVVAVVLGWSILSEHISATTLLGAAVIVSSVAIVVRTESAPASADAPARTPARTGSRARPASESG
jgi:drug/metabolite transporter (DMT)-like permease